LRIVVFDDYKIGALQGAEAVDLSSLAPPQLAGTPAAVMAFIETYADLPGESLQRALSEGSRTQLRDVRLLPPVPRPRQILAAPLNYRPHIAEMADSKHVPSGLDREKTARELGFFVKASGSIAGPADAIELPPWPGREFHHECELGVIIGKEGRAIPLERALDYVFGYTCLIDVTLRMAPGFEEERAMRKSFHSFTPIGPHVVTRDEIADPGQLRLSLWVNGDLRQDSSTANLIVGVPELIRRASEVTTLYPGDIYATGTPEGVGPIVPGDEVRIAIEQVGEMRLPVRLRSW
jgi:2-keto-4-pentenoate hydratase/2-oxohepta-3-ene-1,7-dioic acid hydratase in catechol pathway